MRASHVAKTLAAAALKKNVAQNARAASKDQKPFAAELEAAKSQTSQNAAQVNKQKA